MSGRAYEEDDLALDAGDRLGYSWGEWAIRLVVPGKVVADP